MSEADARPFDRLVLRNVRCFRDATIELDPRVTVLIGENGAGKTTAVEALASLSAGEGEGLSSFPLSRGAKSGEIALFEAGARKPAARWRPGSNEFSGRCLPESRYLFAYGRYRRVFYPEDESAPAGRSSPIADLDELARRSYRQRTTTLFRPDNHLLRDLSRYLAALHVARDSEPRLAAVWDRLNESLAALGQGIVGVEMESGKHEYIPRVVRHGVSLALRELSDGYQAILVVLFDLILRYHFLFTELDDPLLGAATVVIDEVDLHLHPRWQRTVVAQLVALFPSTQFILTTHSPAVVQGAIDGKRRVVALQEEGGGVTARTLSDEETAALRGAEVGSVLVEERLFGVGSRYSPEFAEVEERVAAFQSKIRRGEASDEDRKQLFRDLDTLQRLVAADEERRADGSFLSQMTGLRKAFLEDLAAEIARAKS
jgi:energy-coupling factor transporter ATP-binding protein EcfA2